MVLNALMDEEMEFTVEVDYTDRTRTGLAFTTFTKTVTVLAKDPDEATLIGAQMVAGLIPDENMIIATRITEMAV